MATTQGQLDFNLAVEHDRDSSVIRVEGDLDSFTATGLREAFGGILGRSAAIIDIRGVPFVDSSGLGALVGGIRRFREAGGYVALCCTSRSVLRLLAITGVDRAVTVTATPAEAQARIAAERRSTH